VERDMQFSDENRVQRRLAAILAADVAGYSRLMGTDEEGTLRQLKLHRRVLVDPKITEHRGRIVKTTGDGMLVEFPSVVDAVRCAVEIQRGMIELNVTVAQDKRVEFRIGINVGDIIIDGGDIFGDGVNVAARLEGLSEPGGICVSRVVRDEVRDKLSFDFEDMGEQSVKNIARPVGVHRIQFFGRAAALAAKAVSAPAPPLVELDRPSIAVLPFANMSGDADQEYFADGIAEDIITGLSRVRWLFVIARNSSFVYRGKAVDVRRVASELGVRYVLEGSVRKHGNRIRLTAQLIDATAGSPLWADRYDTELTDIFVLQDEITRNVIAAIEPKLIEAEGLRSLARKSADVGAWDLVMSANSQFWRLTNKEVESAIATLRQAIERYPQYSPAHSMLAFFLLFLLYADGSAADNRLQQATVLASRAVELDDSDPRAHLALGYVAHNARRTQEAIEEFGRALDLNPNFAAAHGYLGWTLAFDGRSDEAIAHLEQAIRTSPQDPQNAIFNFAIATAHYMAGRYTDAVAFCRKALQMRHGLTAAHRLYCASLAQSGQADLARAALSRLKELQPEISIDWIERHVPYRPGPMRHFLEGMRRAGVE